MIGYAVCIAPITGLMVADYFFYESPPDSIYYYWKGVNWHTFVVWIFGVGPTIPGFPHQSVRAKITVPSVPWKFIIFAVLVTGFAISGFAHIVLDKISRSLASAKSMMMTSLAPPLRKKLNPKKERLSTRRK
ncbi:NCS1 family nucleobase:cation symporter-1 [Cryptococcus neoformans]|nr:NCS1 family nucleobase:cation symporter-1 [Cryptococcus neoformans var. grubii]